MKQKLISLIRIAAVMTVVTLAGYFGNEISLILTESFSIGDLIRHTASSGSIILVLWMYCHYVLKQPFRAFDIKRPVFKLRWLLVGLMCPAVLNGCYLMTTSGTVTFNRPAPINLLNGLLTMFLYESLFKALWQGIAFRGFLFKTLRKPWSTPAAILIPGVVILLLQNGISMEPEMLPFSAVAILLYHTALCFVTLESTSIWSSVWIDALFRAFFLQNMIFYINPIDDPTMTGQMMLWKYLFHSNHFLLTGVNHGSYYDLSSALPALLCDCAIIAYAVYRIKQPSHAKGTNAV